MKQGFTLIELLVVIGIILLLSLIGISQLNVSRQKARDAKHIADARQIQTALQLYYSDENEFPAAAQPIAIGTASTAKLCDKASGGFVAPTAACTVTYMLDVPAGFQYVSDGAQFAVGFATEQESYLGPAGQYRATKDSMGK